MTRKTTQNKSDLTNAISGKERPERLSLNESRDLIYEKFYNNLRLLVATQPQSMVNLARDLGLKSGSRISDLTYGKGIPSTEELIVLSKHFKCTIDDLLNNTLELKWAQGNQPLKN